MIKVIFSFIYLTMYLPHLSFWSTGTGGSCLLTPHWLSSAQHSGTQKTFINSYLLLKISLYSCVTGIPLGIQLWGPFRMFINSYFVLWSLKFLFSSDKGEVIAWKSLLLFLLLKCGYSNFLGLTSQHRPENPLAVSAATAAPTSHTCAQGAMTCYKGCILQGDRHYRD